MSVFRRCVTNAFVAAVVVASVGAGVAAAQPLPPMPLDQNQLPSLPSEPQIYSVFPLTPPDQDPWYAEPANLGDIANGDVVRTREVQHYVFGLPWPVNARQILYRSTDSHGTPIVTATTVLTPGIPWNGGPRPLVSYQEAIDATASVCNPSYAAGRHIQGIRSPATVPGPGYGGGGSRLQRKAEHIPVSE